ncbi:MAG: DegQ family serine endoprotease [bacterium]|nr:MAG: DegQ family serine endoprotease [bacterium]
MSKNHVFRYGFILVFLGIVIGIIISANFNMTDQIQADSPVPASPESQISETINTKTLQDFSTAFADIAEKVKPSVVTIFTEKIIKSRRSPFFQFPFEQFFGEDFEKHFNVPQNPQREQKQFGLGSGVIVSEDGIILTNNHVIEGADEIKVRLLENKKEYVAQVKGFDARTDLAILKIEAANLPKINFGDSDAARVGEWVLAIGSPLSPELAHTVTSGIISAKGRSGLFDPGQYEDFIQTDAAINPGNSGGALVDLHGNLIGLNTAIASRTGGFMGIGFAIPANLANKVMNDILTKGKVVRGWLGVSIQDVDEDLAKALNLPNTNGVLVPSVQEDSPAEKAGIKAEDVIIELNGRDIKNSSELRNLVAATNPGTNVKLTILRAGKEKEISVTLGELPEEQPLAQQSPKTSEKIGITVSNITPALIDKFELPVKKDGVVIIEVQGGSVAAQSGLRPGDVILSVNRKNVKNVTEYNSLIGEVGEGDTILFYVQRGDGKIFVAFAIPS